MHAYSTFHRVYVRIKSKTTKLFIAESHELKKSFLLHFSLYSFSIFKVSKIAAKLYEESPFKSLLSYYISVKNHSSAVHGYTIYSSSFYIVCSNQID